MKARRTNWLLVVALAAAAPLYAQRAGGHAGGGGFHGGGMPAAHSSGFSGHATQFHGSAGYRGAPTYRFSGAGRMSPRYGASGRMPLGPGSSVLHRSSGYGSHYGAAARPAIHRGGANYGHSNSSNSWNRRRPWHGYGWGRYNNVTVYYGGGYGWYGYGYAPWLFYPWLDADLSWNLWNDSSDGYFAADGSQAAQPDSGPQDEDASTAMSYEDPNAPMHPQAASMQSDAPPATLLFRDGRTPLRTNNYAVSAQGVTVADSGRVQTIPLGDIDISATNKLNADTGSGLVLP